jgi:enoyl-CoA hydratase/carnithine racemase
MSGQIQLEIDGPLARVILSHPGKFNAMSCAMWGALKNVFDDLQQRRDLRCVTLQGKGGHFCAGGDISEYAGFRFDADKLRHFHEVQVWGGLNAILQCDLPVIAQIEGNCMGAGLELASCCDIRIAGQSAQFGAPIAKLGFAMAPREAALVGRAVGDLTAREILLEAAVLNAALMQQRGFLNVVVPDVEVADTVLQRMRRLQGLAPQAARSHKQTLRALAAPSPAIERLVETAYDYANSAEHREGIEAFVAKRKPVFLS